MRVGVTGFGKHFWPSVERTRSFYWRALTSSFDVVPIEEADVLSVAPQFDALLNFTESRCWNLPQHPACPILFGMHGGPILDQAFLRDHLERLETTDVLIVNCTSDIKIFEKMFAGTPQLCHLPLPVDTTLFRPLDPFTCRQQLKLENVDYVIGFVARLLPQKNLHGFLRLFARIKQRLHPRKVAGIVIGNYWIDYPILNYVTDAYPNYIGNLVKSLGIAHNLAYFPAKIPDEDLPVFYSAMDLLIHPTHAIDENFGYVPVEAMACGVPVLGAAYGGLKDTIASGETGFLMPTWITRSGIRMDTGKGLEDSLKLLTDRALRERMSRAAVQCVRERYHFHACADILCGAVAEAARAKRDGQARPLRLLPLHPQPESEGLLPPIRKPWEVYKPVVADYVSHPTPRLEDGASLQLAAPLRVEADGYRLDDPAWPALFRLTPPDLALIEKCTAETSVDRLELPEGMHRTRIETLIEMGLLLCSQRKDSSLELGKQ